MDDMIGPGQIEPGPAGLDRKNHKRNIILAIKCFRHLLPALHSRPAMQNESLGMKDLFQKFRQMLRNLSVLRKYKDTLSLFVDGLTDLAKHGKFAALLRVVSLLSQELIRVVTDLLELGDGRKNNPAALHSFRFRNCLLQLAYLLAVEHDLLC